MIPPRFLPALLALAPAAAAQHDRPTGPLERVPYGEHLVVALQPGVDAEAFAALTGCRLVHASARGHALLAPPPGVGAEHVVSFAVAVKGVPGVIYATSDDESHPPETGTCALDDEAEVVGQQCTIAWVDGSPSDGEYDEQPAREQVRADEANAVASGSARVVAVIDTGVDPTHPLISERLHAPGYDYLLGQPGGFDAPNGLDDDGDGLVDEGVGHGTHVAGSVLLIDPTALVLPMRVLDSEGVGSAYFVSQAIFDSVDQGAHVINLSLSLRCENDAVAEALMYAEHHGVEVVTSAGNTGAEVLFPGSYDPADFAFTPSWLPAGTELDGSNLLTIAAVDDLDVMAVFSAHGSDVDLAAPGVDVYSALLGGGYAWWSGTSMATGIGSGSVSFLLSIAPAGYAGTAGEALLQTAFDLDPLNPSHAGELGAGRIDLYEASLLVLE